MKSISWRHHKYKLFFSCNIIEVVKNYTIIHYQLLSIVDGCGCGLCLKSYVLQESEVVYSGRLSLVGDLLQALFKEAYTLQKGLMELLDHISLQETASDEEVSDIVTGIEVTH